MTKSMKIIEAGAPGATPTRDRDGLFRKRGVWHCKLLVDGRWRQFSTRTGNYNQARRERRALIDRIEAGQLPADTGRWPIERAAEAWMASRKGRIASNTAMVDRDRCKVLCRYFPGRRLETLTPADVQRFQSERLESGAAPKTINLDCSCLQGILRWAKLWGRFRDEVKPLPRPKQGPGRALSPEEERRLFAAAASRPEWEVAYCAGLLGANTTMRPGEIRGLRLADADLFARVVTVRRSTTKTDAGERIIPLNEAALWALSRLRQRAEMLGAREPQHFLLPFMADKRHKAERGSAFDPTRPMRSWKAAWYAMRDKAGLPGLRPHDMRHCAITKLAESGAPDQVIMEIAGHVSPEMLRHYSHIRLQAKRSALDAISAGWPAQQASPAAAEEGATPCVQ